MSSSVMVDRPAARVMLQPIAEPAVLGYLSLGSALIVWGSWFAGGWGTDADATTFAPFILLFGGFGQLGAALWSYRGRAAVSAALHGSWGAFWLGLATIYLLAGGHAVHVPARGEPWQSIGQWLIYMAVISLTTAVAALARSGLGFLVQATLTAGAALAAAGLLSGSAGLARAGGWVFVAAGTLGFALGASRMFFGPGAPIQFEGGDPGVKVGQ